VETLKGKKTILREEQVIDQETGEIIYTKTNIQFDKEPDFVKLYLDCLGVFTNNTGLNNSLNDMLLAVLKHMTYASQEQIVILNNYIKDAICKETNKSMKRLNQAITIWVKEKVLIRVGRGVYKVNPYIFGRGDWRDISKLRATFNFADGTVETVKEYTPKETKKIC
jgi:hypothetical protein